MESEFTLVSDNSAAMSAVAETTALVEQNGYLFVAYTSEYLEATIAMYDPTAQEWSYTPLGTNVDDAHNVTSVGVDADGYVHACRDLHNAPSFLGHYKRSVHPYNIGLMIHEEIDQPGQSQSTSVSYARFYRVGGELYLLFRSGLPTAGNEHMKKWDRTAQQWDDVAIPLIDGLSMNPTDNPYMGVGIGNDLDLHLIWTHRIDLYNYRLLHARYATANNVWASVENDLLTIPLTRDSVSSITDVNDATISNSGLGVVITDNGYPVICYRRHVNGYAEAFCASYDFLSEKWESVQLSCSQLPRLRMCPNGPQEPESPPRPCDIERQGPFIIKLSSGRLVVLYGRTVGQRNESWQRPGAIIYAHLSDDNGITWSEEIEVKRPVDHLFGDLIRETNGKPLLLAQELSSESGPLWIWDLDKSDLATYPMDELVNVSNSAGNYLVAPGLRVPSYSNLSISAWVRPANNNSRMGIIDRGGSTERRQFRLLLWAGDGPTMVDQNKIQVLLGSSGGGWGLVWRPTVLVNPGEWTHLVVIYDQGMSSVIVFKNGIEVASMVYDAGLSSVSSDMLIGGNFTASNIPENKFSGDLEVKLYNYALSLDQISGLYKKGK